jgi:hypothetical protein
MVICWESICLSMSRLSTVFANDFRSCFRRRCWSVSGRRIERCIPPLCPGRSTRARNRSSTVLNRGVIFGFWGICRRVSGRRIERCVSSLCPGRSPRAHRRECSNGLFVIWVSGRASGRCWVSWCEGSRGVGRLRVRTRVVLVGRSVSAFWAEITSGSGDVWRHGSRVGVNRSALRSERASG